MRPKYLSDILPIAITILECEGKYLFLKRRQPPYENLWGLVGGKIDFGEHVTRAAIREILEETGAREVHNYSLRGFVSERLIDQDGTLKRHFLIFVGHGQIDSFSPNHREGILSLFDIDEIHQQQEQFLPSDWYMFDAFREPKNCGLYEAELVHKDGCYTLSYFQVAKC